MTTVTLPRTWETVVRLLQADNLLARRDAVAIAQMIVEDAIVASLPPGDYIPTVGDYGGFMRSLRLALGRDRLSVSWSQVQLAYSARNAVAHDTICPGEPTSAR